MCLVPSCLAVFLASASSLSRYVGLVAVRAHAFFSEGKHGGLKKKCRINSAGKGYERGAHVFNMAIRFLIFFRGLSGFGLQHTLIFSAVNSSILSETAKVKVLSPSAFISGFSTSFALAEAYLRIRLPAMFITPFFPARSSARRKQARQGR